MGRAELQAHLIEEGVATYRQGHGEADQPHGPMVSVAKPRIAEGMHGHHLGVGGVEARFQGRDRGDHLESARRRKSLKGPVQQRRIWGIKAGPLAAGGAIGEHIGIKGGAAGNGPNRTGLGVHRHNRPLADAIEGPLRRLLQR